MGDGFQFLDVILLAMVAAFVLLRLRSVLGRRTGHHQQRPESRFPAPENKDDKVVVLPDRTARADGEVRTGPLAGGPAGAGLTRIGMADRDFDASEFLEGAKAAYEMVVTAFASGDVKTLRPLLSSDVFGDFSRAIKEREDRGQKQETTLVGIKAADIVEADLKGRTAEVTVRFASELVNATRDAEGNVVAGNPNAVDQVTDVWTFARDLRSRDPNWTLVATSEPA